MFRIGRESKDVEVRVCLDDGSAVPTERFEGVTWK
jgi:hypothetical protein